MKLPSQALPIDKPKEIELLPNEQLLNYIHDVLKKKDIKDTVEILGNLFVRIGGQNLKLPPDSVLNGSNIYEKVLSDIKENGNTLSNALVRQGLVLLDWLEEGKI